MWRRQWTLSCDEAWEDYSTFVLFIFDPKDGQIYMHRAWYGDIPRWMRWLIRLGFVRAVAER